MTALEAACDLLARDGRAWAKCGDTKAAIRHFLRIGFAAPEFRARYGRLFNEFDGHTLVTAMRAVELAYILEKRRRANSKALWGRPMGDRQHWDRLKEMRLMLRHLSTRTTHREWQQMCAAVTNRWHMWPAQAAE